MLRLQCPVYTSLSHCACTHLALQGREWPWGSHPTATTRIEKAAMLKCYCVQAIAEIRRVDDSFHSIPYNGYHAVISIKTRQLFKAWPGYSNSQLRCLLLPNYACGCYANSINNISSYHHRENKVPCSETLYPTDGSHLVKRTDRWLEGSQHHLMPPHHVGA